MRIKTLQKDKEDRGNVKYKKIVKYDVGSDEDKMVRVPKDMYMAIYEIIKEYPYYGWKGPSEFVRDAIRRYVKEIKERELMLRRAMENMPNKAEDTLSNFMDPEEAKELAEKISQVKEEEPEKYVQEVVKILQHRLGRTLAELLARRLLEVGENED